jgi:hypothetical protein
VRAKAAIATVFALVLAAAAVCGEQYRLETESAVNNDSAAKPARVAARDFDVTN